MKKIFPRISFSAILLAFFLPFFIVKCNDKELGKISGLELVVGSDIGDKNILSESSNDAEPNVFAIIGFLGTIAGLVFAFTKIKRWRLYSFILSILGSLSLFLLYLSAISEESKGGLMAKITISIGIGFYIALTGYILNSFYFSVFLKKKANSETKESPILNSNN